MSYSDELFVLNHRWSDSVIFIKQGIVKIWSNKNSKGLVGLKVQANGDTQYVAEFTVSTI